MSTSPAPTECGCGMTAPQGFPHRLVRGDRCPIGPFRLHHWHGSVCVFCGGTVVLDTIGGRHYGIDNGEPVCCGEPMVHNCGGWYECADAYFLLASEDAEHPEDRVLGDTGLIVEMGELTDYQRERYDHWMAIRVTDEAVADAHH